MNHTEHFFAQAVLAASGIDYVRIEALAKALIALRSRRGRLFVIGLGGGAANAGHAVNDFRKLCGIEAYCATDNVAEFSARANDDGLHRVFVEFLKGSNASRKDALLVFSVGGGDLERNVSASIVHAVDYAQTIGMDVYGIVGRPDGHVGRLGDIAIVVPHQDALVTPLTESFQMLVLHCLVSHPKLQQNACVW